MNSFQRVTSTAQLHALANGTGLAPLADSLFTRHAPDAHWVLMQNAIAPGEQGLSAHSSAILAYCSLWWTHTPPYPGQQLGLIGHYAVQNPEAAIALLHHACQELATKGCSLAIAPMDGTTWRSYRLVSDRGTEPPFFLEPNTPTEWCDTFQQAGFAPFATYRSALNTDLTQRDGRVQAVEQRLHALGVEVRSLNVDAFDQELQQIYALCLISFRQNVLYTPIDESEFVAQYSDVKPYIQPDFVLLATHKERLVGFIFALPDLLQARRGEPIDTMIIKTVAVRPERAYAGLGSVLVERIQAIAYERGYRRVIHALMHDGNKSRNLSGHYAHTIRRYTLFAKPL